MHDGAVIALWPFLGEDHPRSRDLDATYGRLTTDRSRNLATGKWDPIHRGPERPLLRIVCTEHNRAGDGPRMLAEVWHTVDGLFFLSRLPGAVADPADDPTDPFAPPSAVLPDRVKRARRSATTTPARGDEWRPVPITIVRLFLNDPATNDARLWVKCADHGAATVDRVRLYKEHRADQERRRHLYTPEPAVVPLHDVRTLS